MKMSELKSMLKTVCEECKLKGFKIEYFNDKFFLSIWREDFTTNLVPLEVDMDTEFDDKEIRNIIRFINEYFPGENK